MTSTARTDRGGVAGIGDPIDLPPPANATESRIDRLTREIAENTAQIKELARLADSDPALPVLNQRAFMREANRLCLLARRHKFPLALLYANVDDFRAVNQTYGRRGGDAVLETLSHHLERLTRGSDLVGRVGADEFCALLSHTSQDAAASKGRALRELLQQEPPIYLGRTIDVHLTFGALDVDGRLLAEATDEAIRDILEQRQHRLP
jgi:diguanylate cyclase (GGDEF)-like protein